MHVVCVSADTRCCYDFLNLHNSLLFILIPYKPLIFSPRHQRFLWIPPSHPRGRGICTGGKGHILVVDTENCRVQVFTADGSFTSSFSCSDKPYDVAVDNTGKIHIVLYSPNRVEVFSRDGGQPQSTYDAGGNLRSPYSITIDDSGYIFVGDYGKDCVRVIDPQGGLVSTSGTRIDA